MSNRPSHSPHRWTIVALLAALLAAPLTAGSRPLTFEDLVAPQARPEIVGTAREAGQQAARMEELQGRLASVGVEAALDRPTRIELSASERQRIDVLGSSERRFLVGVGSPLGLDVALTPAGLAAGATTRVGPGFAAGAGNAEIVWTAAFEAPGATALRLWISGVDLPKGSSLWVYNLDGQAFGPYTGRGPLGNGELHTHTVRGDRLILQLHAPGHELRPARFRVEEAGVLGRRFLPARFGPPLKGTVEATEASNLCSYNADCVVNAGCQSSNAVNAAKDAIATYLFRSGGSYYICTGGLIADSDTSSVIPYFLTANHCVSRAREAESVETYFDYATDCASPDCTQPYSNNGETIGATIKSASSSNDHSLLQLSSAPTTPDGVAAYLGWNSTAVANSNGTPLYRISHPSGAPQAYSEQVVDTGKGTCGTLPRGRYIYSTDVVGATEGGSSGSPVVNGAGQVVGQLYGACGFNVNDVCDSASNATVDGAFADYFTSVAPFLAGGGGTCSPTGASCSANADCCSNSCKGKPGAKVCK